MARPKRLPRRDRQRLAAFGTAATLLFVGLFVTLKPTPAVPMPEPLTPETIALPVPTRIVARGERLDAAPFTTIAWPKSKLKGAYLTDQRDLRDGFAMAPLPPYLPIPLSAVSTAPLDANAVVEAIPEGMRAITIKVDAESAVEGWARSGNFVDVILIRTGREPAAGLESLVIAENVKILSAGSSAVPVTSGDTAPHPPTTITLLTSQENALRIKTAGNLGKLTFALRGSGDNSAATVTALDQRRVLGTPDVPKTVFRGKARGPDGKMYVLGGDSRWLNASESVAQLAKNGGTP